VDDREDAAVCIAANLEVVLVDQRKDVKAQIRETVLRLHASRFAQLRGVHEHESNPKIPFDVESVSIDDTGHGSLDAQARQSRAVR